MSNLHVAFWNVQNLFEPDTVDRGPQSQQELNSKLEVIANVVNSFFQGSGPDVLGLAEVHTERILLELMDRLDEDYIHCWENPGSPTQTGLGLIARRNRFVDLETLAVQRPSIAARPRSMIVRCQLQGSPEPVLVVVNHWKSNLGSPDLNNADRLETADWLGEYLANDATEPCVLVIGDFNAEPYEPPFGELRLRGRRTFSNALWSNATPAYLYNTAWKFLTEPADWETASQPDYKEPRPKTTHGDSGAHIYDHLLVSGRALKNGPITLRESTLHLFQNPWTVQTTRTGILRPKAWSYSPEDFSGSSDHFPVLCSFLVN